MTLGGRAFGAELVDGSATWTFDGQGQVFAFGELFVAVGTADVVHVLQNLYGIWSPCRTQSTGARPWLSCSSLCEVVLYWVLLHAMQRRVFLLVLG